MLQKSHMQNFQHLLLQSESYYSQSRLDTVLLCTVLSVTTVLVASHLSSLRIYEYNPSITGCQVGPQTTVRERAKLYSNKLHYMDSRLIQVFIH